MTNYYHLRLSPRHYVSRSLSRSSAPSGWRGTAITMINTTRRRAGAGPHNNNNIVYAFGIFGVSRITSLWSAADRSDL